MRKCISCPEEIEDGLAKCPFCGAIQLTAKGDKWYFKFSVFVIAFLCVGPFALPLLWFNPRFSLAKKIIISLIVIVITYFLTIYFANSLKAIYSYYRILSHPLQ
ncbi:MAG: hypothetical protein PHE61_07700 [Candidatus Omnitrophica bacterium]|nr:hypothetical protein [Candidatus Omnitrophota bacterium]